MDVGAELKLVHNKVSVLQSSEFRTCIFEIFPPSVWSEEGGWLGWGWGAGWVVTWHIYLYLNWVGAGLNFSITRQLQAVLCSVPSLLFIPHTLHLCDTVTWFVISNVSIALEYWDKRGRSVARIRCTCIIALRKCLASSSKAICNLLDSRLANLLWLWLVSPLLLLSLYLKQHITKHVLYMPQLCCGGMYLVSSRVPVYSIVVKSVTFQVNCTEQAVLKWFK